MERVDAVALLQQLLNKDLVEVARQYNVTIFKEGKKNKG